MPLLAQKTMIGSFQLIGSMAVLLFVPAGSLDFKQAWIYLCISSVAVIGIAGYLYKNDPKLLERRLKTTEQERMQQQLQLWVYTATIGLFVFSALDHHYAWSGVPCFLVIAGDILTALGYAIIFMGFKANTFAAATIEVTAGHTLITKGLYGIIRHPVYLGGLVMLLGTPLALGSWGGFVFFILIILGILCRLCDEERILCQNLSGYVAYCQRVPYRLLPFIW